MRDHALQQAEEARGKLQAAEEILCVAQRVVSTCQEQHELFRAQMEGAAASPEAETAREEVADLSGAWRMATRRLEAQRPEAAATAEAFGATPERVAAAGLGSEVGRWTA